MIGLYETSTGELVLLRCSLAGLPCTSRNIVLHRVSPTPGWDGAFVGLDGMEAGRSPMVMIVPDGQSGLSKPVWTSTTMSAAAFRVVSNFSAMTLGTNNRAGHHPHPDARRERLIDTAWGRVMLSRNLIFAVRQVMNHDGSHTTEGRLRCGSQFSVLQGLSAVQFEGTLRLAPN